MRSGFNTQPPEGGWIQPHIARHAARRFNTQPPEGGWASNRKVSDDCLWFQHTAARRRLGRLPKRLLKSTKFQHTAARRRLVDVNLRSLIGEHSFNTQPPEGGWTFSVLFEKPFSSFNTQPPEGGWANKMGGLTRLEWFQHTAARRLVETGLISSCPEHSFNTQPPEGGWEQPTKFAISYCVSTHSKPKPKPAKFQHTAARRRLVWV